MSEFLTSSIGKKLIMSLAGLFLVSFLLVHLGINFLLVLFESRYKFNVAAHFMGTNPIIKVFEIVLFGGFLLHMLYGVILSVQNMIARGKQRYKLTNHSQTSFFSKYMFHTAIVVTIFLVIHISNFYVKAKFLGAAEDVTYDGVNYYHDLGKMVIEFFQMPIYVISYIICILFVGFHLHHGFQSAFQSLGINHKTYTPVIKALGNIYTFVVTGGFIYIPIHLYFFR